jgi:hypothetical protein
MIVLGIRNGRVAYLATYSAGVIRSKRTLHAYLARGL